MNTTEKKLDEVFSKYIRARDKKCMVMSKIICYYEYMQKMKDITNQKFGRLRAIQPVSQNKYKKYKWECLCDCGETKIILSNSLLSGHVKSCGCALKGINTGDKNGNWTGDNVGKTGLHRWATRHKSKPSKCEDCGENSPYDLANISQQYKRDVNDFKWVCRKCHMQEDGRLLNLIQHQYGKKID